MAPVHDNCKHYRGRNTVPDVAGLESCWCMVGTTPVLLARAQQGLKTWWADVQAQGTRVHSLWLGWHGSTFPGAEIEGSGLGLK